MYLFCLPFFPFSEYFNFLVKMILVGISCVLLWLACFWTFLEINYFVLARLVLWWTFSCPV